MRSSHAPVFSVSFPFELFVGGLEQIAGHHVGIAQVLIKEIAIHDLDAIAQPPEPSKTSRVGATKVAYPSAVPNTGEYGGTNRQD